MFSKSWSRRIRRIIVDAGTREPACLDADPSLITVVLRHADDLAGILQNIVPEQI